jgi:hypothetical protein
MQRFCKQTSTPISISCTPSSRRFARLAFPRYADLQVLQSLVTPKHIIHSTHLLPTLRRTATPPLDRKKTTAMHFNDLNDLNGSEDEDSIWARTRARSDISSGHSAKREAAAAVAKRGQNLHNRHVAESQQILEMNRRAEPRESLNETIRYVRALNEWRRSGREQLIKNELLRRHKIPPRMILRLSAGGQVSPTSKKMHHVSIRAY